MPFFHRNVKLPSGSNLNELIGGVPGGLDGELDAYLMAKSYFDLKEYDRAAHFTEGAKSQKLIFLHLYSR